MVFVLYFLNNSFLCNKCTRFARSAGRGAIKIIMQRPGIKPVSGKQSTHEPPTLKWKDFDSSLINQNLIVQLHNIISNPSFSV